MTIPEAVSQKMQDLSVEQQRMILTFTEFLGAPHFCKSTAGQHLEILHCPLNPPVMGFVN